MHKIEANSMTML